MTANELRTLLDIYVNGTPQLKVGGEQISQILAILLYHGLIEDINPGIEYKITEKGSVFVEAILETELPVKKYIME